MSKIMTLPEAIENFHLQLMKLVHPLTKSISFSALQYYFNLSHKTLIKWLTELENNNLIKLNYRKRKYLNKQGSFSVISIVEVL